MQFDDRYKSRREVVFYITKYLDIPCNRDLQEKDTCWDKETRRDSQHRRKHGRIVELKEYNTSLYQKL